MNTGNAQLSSNQYQGVYNLLEKIKRGADRVDIAKLEPYATRLRVHRTLQTEDHIFTSQHGAGSLLNLARLENGTNAAGFLGTVTLAVDPDATPAPVRGFGPPVR